MSWSAAASRFLFGSFPVLPLLALTACESPQEPTLEIVFELTRLQEDTLTAPAGHPVARQIEVQALNQRRKLLPGIEVEFVVTEGEGTLEPRTARTDAGGVARATWTLGPRIGIQRAEARLTGRRAAPVLLVARGVPGSPALVNVSGDDQWQVVNRSLEEPLVVRVTDAHGNPVPAAAVAWSTGQGTLVPEADSTDPTGTVRAAWTMGALPGAHMATAVLTGMDTIRFRAMAEPEVLSVSIELERKEVLQTGSTHVRTNLAWIRHPVRQIWTISDTLVALMDTASGRVTAGTPGTAVISLTVQGRTASTTFRSVGVEGYQIENVGFTSGPWRGAHRTGSLLNDSGEVAAVNGNRLMLLRNGRRTEISLTPLLITEGLEAVDFGNSGAVLVFREQRVPTVDTRSPRTGESWIIRNGEAVRLMYAPAYPYAINDEDAVVGVTGRPGDSVRRGFLWVQGHTTLLPHPPHPDSGLTEAVAINRQGQVAVNAWNRDWNQGRAYLWDGGGYTAIPQPHSSCSGWHARGMNNLGAVLIACESYGGLSFLWTGDTFIPLAPLRWGAQVNDRGEVLGFESRPGGGVCGKYLWRAGQGRCLVESVASGDQLNNRGQILLWDRDLLSGDYLLTPDP